MTMTPVLLDTFGSQDRRTCTLDPLNRVIITPLTLVSCPFITERWTCWPVFAHRWAALGAPIASVVSEWDTSCIL